MRTRSATATTPGTASTSPDTYATVYKKNETLGGGDRYFERKIVTEHRFARRTPRLSGDGEDGDKRDERDRDECDSDERYDESDHGGRDRHERDESRRPRSAGMPTIVSRSNVTVLKSASADKPAKKRSRLDKFKMLFTGGGSSSASKENKRPSSGKTQYNSSDPESYTSSLRKRYNVFTGNENVSI